MQPGTPGPARLSWLQRCPRPETGTRGRDPALRLLRGPEVNPGGPGAARGLPQGRSPPGRGLPPGLAALSSARCLAAVTRDRASRANSGVPGAQHVLSTTPSFTSGSPHPPYCLPHAPEATLRAFPRLQRVPACPCCCFLGVCQGVGRVGWFQGSPRGHPSRSQARTRKACVSSWPVTAASSESDLLVPFLVLVCLVKRESKNFSGQSRCELKL